MIAIDTSALMAVVKNEPEADRCAQVLLREPVLVISAGTLAEALIVAARQGVDAEMAHLILGLQWDVAAVDEPAARRVADAYNRWGKGVHDARLNLGDCFAYEVASRMRCPLLYVGNDFSKTDLVSALSGRP